MLPEIFDLFMQVDSSLRALQGGLGIGLTLVKRSSSCTAAPSRPAARAPGRGSEFVVRLPRRGRDAVRNRRTESRRAPAGPPRILIVDDNRDAAETLAPAARAMGHEVGRPRRAVGRRDRAQFRPGDRVPRHRPARHERLSRSPVGSAQPGLKDLVIVALTGYGREDDVRRGAPGRRLRRFRRQDRSSSHSSRT